MVKISVIVPVYNTEKYLSRCIDSILGQTFQDFELLLIDDGSKDYSAVICDEYAKIDARIRVFHKLNEGVSSARNIGLDYAVGDWITFVDSDDWLDSNYFELLYKGNQSDLSILSFKVEGENIYNQDFPSGTFKTKEIGELLQNFGEYPQLSAPWVKLFKNSIIQSYHIRFCKVLHTAEDTLFVLEYIEHISSIYSNQHAVYHYQHMDGGLSGNLHNNHESYNLILEKLSKELLVLSKLFSFDSNLLFVKLSEGRLFQEFRYIISVSSGCKTYRLISSLLSNQFVNYYFKSVPLLRFGRKGFLFCFFGKYRFSFLMYLYLLLFNLFKKNFLKL